jgi:hypothetical protein
MRQILPDVRLCAGASFTVWGTVLRAVQYKPVLQILYKTRII